MAHVVNPEMPSLTLTRKTSQDNLFISHTFVDRKFKNEGFQYLIESFLISLQQNSVKLRQNIKKGIFIFLFKSVFGGRHRKSDIFPTFSLFYIENDNGGPVENRGL